MKLQGKKLGILLSTVPAHPNFTHGIRLAETAVANGVEVYLYCVDEAVPGSTDPRLLALKERGLRLFACAYGAHKRDLPTSGEAIFAGLTVVADLIADTDRFVSFN
jgi:hypothetical protein